jgi:SAM-dependent methyltransferase
MRDEQAKRAMIRGAMIWPLRITRGSSSKSWTASRLTVPSWSACEIDGRQGQGVRYRCGPGEVACYLKNCGLDVTGVDISAEMIAQAKS